MTVTGAVPTIARDLVRLADSAGRKHDRFRAKNFESPALAIVTERARDSVAVLKKREDAHLHVNFDSAVNTVVLQCANHFQTSPIAYVREPWIFVAAEISLQNPPILCSIEHCAPRFKFADTRGCFLGMQFGHAPIVDVLAAAHRVGEMHLPVIAIVDVGERRGDAAFGHYRVRFAEKTFANHADRNACGRRFNGRPQAGAA